MYIHVYIHVYIHQTRRKIKQFLKIFNHERRNHHAKDYRDWKAWEG